MMSFEEIIAENDDYDDNVELVVDGEVVVVVGFAGSAGLCRHHPAGCMR